MPKRVTSQTFGTKDRELTPDAATRGTEPAKEVCVRGWVKSESEVVSTPSDRGGTTKRPACGGALIPCYVIEVKIPKIVRLCNDLTNREAPIRLHLQKFWMPKRSGALHKKLESTREKICLVSFVPAYSG